MNRDKQKRIQERIDCAKHHFTRLVVALHNAETIVGRAEDGAPLPDAKKAYLISLRAEMVKEFRGMAYELGLSSELRDVGTGT